MGKCTIRTILNLLSAFPLNNPRIAWTILILVQWAITKKAVKILPLFYLVTWKVFTLFILKVTVTVLHNNSPFFRVKNLIFQSNLLSQYWKLVKYHFSCKCMKNIFFPAPAQLQCCYKMRLMACSILDSSILFQNIHPL